MVANLSSDGVEVWRAGRPLSGVVFYSLLMAVVDAADTAFGESWVVGEDRTGLFAGFAAGDDLPVPVAELFFSGLVFGFLLGFGEHWVLALAWSGWGGPG